MWGVIATIILSLLIHGAILCFGSLLLPGAHGKGKSAQTVELLSEDLKVTEVKKEPDPKPEDQVPPVDPKDKPPDIVDAVVHAEDNAAPALDAASLSAIESALNPGAGGDAFGGAVSFASGGRVGGTGKAGGHGGGDDLDKAFSMDEIDQRPRVTMQTPPTYPAELKGKKLEGVVQVMFVVDASGRVTNPRVERSSDPAFEKPALNAVRQWRFEPAVKAGKRVPCRMRAPIRFQPA